MNIYGITLKINRLKIIIIRLALSNWIKEQQQKKKQQKQIYI